MTGSPTSYSTAPSVPVPKLPAGQKTLVTGANSGTGQGVAIALGEAGVDVVVHYIEGDAAAAADIRKSGVNAFSHWADVSSEDGVAGTFRRMVKEFGTREAVHAFMRRGVVPSVSCAADKVICLSSAHQEIPWARHVNYASSKGGIKLMMESPAQELAPRRFSVDAIAAGAIRTPINTAAWQIREGYDR
jgi:glucose 1-dehydrogenase